MKRQMLLGLVIVFGCCAPTTGYSEEKLLHENNYETALSFVNLVQKRYYVIRRLEGAVDHLLFHYGALCGQNRGDASRAGEVQVKTSQDYAQSEKDYRDCKQLGCSLERELSLVTTFWQDCLSYKRIMSDTQVRELLAHLIVLYDGLLKVCGKESGLSTTKAIFFKNGLDDLLDTVDVLTATSRSFFASKPLSWKPLGWQTYELPQFFFPELGEGKDVSASDKPTAGQPLANQLMAEEPTVEEPDEEILKVLDGSYRNDYFLVNTTVRFYLLQRIAVSMEQLSKIASSKDISRVCAQLQSIDAFKSRHIRECLQKVGAEGSLQPLFKLWENVGSYRYISDPYLIREMLLIVVQVYKVFMKVLVPHQEQAEAQADKVLDVYTTISSLPLPELFMLLDELTQQSLSIITSVHQGATLEWKVMFKQYWWLPPVVVAGCATLYLRIKHLLWHPQYRTV